MGARALFRRGSIGVAAIAAALLLPPGVQAATGPDSQTQPLADGCQRSPSGLLTFSSPEWVYVNHDPNAHLVEGVAHSTHTAGGDLPEGHDSYDLNSNITVDSQYSNLLATANFTGDPSAEDYGRLHVEWETGSVPMFVWPTEGDRVKLWGSWSWDCGHWGTSFSTTNPDYLLPGQGETNCAGCPGERSEFHPMRAMVVTRANPYQPTTRTTQTDVYISNQGTTAHAEEQCALENPPTNADTYPPSWTACVRIPQKSTRRSTTATTRSLSRRRRSRFRARAHLPGGRRGARQRAAGAGAGPLQRHPGDGPLPGLPRQRQPLDLWQELLCQLAKPTPRSRLSTYRRSSRP